MGREEGSGEREGEGEKYTQRRKYKKKRIEISFKERRKGVKCHNLYSWIKYYNIVLHDP